MHEFEATAEPRQFELYKKTVTGREVEESARMKQIAFDGNDGRKLGVDAAHWFAMITAKINLLKAVEDKLAEDVVAVAGHIQSSSQRTLLSVPGAGFGGAGRDRCSRLLHDT